MLKSKDNLLTITLHKIKLLFYLHTNTTDDGEFFFNFKIIIINSRSGVWKKFFRKSNYLCAAS
ncbi:MAG: hypothetical protein ACI8P3_002908 [Saprospiraceae bacterium]|jgi:hypothetical protein